MRIVYKVYAFQEGVNRLFRPCCPIPATAQARLAREAPKSLPAVRVQELLRLS